MRIGTPRGLAGTHGSASGLFCEQLGVGTTKGGKKYVNKRTYRLCQGHLPGNESRQLFLLHKK